MSLYGVLRSGVSGMNAQSNKLGTVAENIQNANTSGYKRASTEFSSLILPSSEGNYNSGSVTSKVRYSIGDQGPVTYTTSTSDLAISGNGFFVVTDPKGSPYITRAGSFVIDGPTGTLINNAGFTLMGYSLAQGAANPSLNSLDNLVPINVASLGMQANGSTSGALKGNLPYGASTAAQTITPADYDPLGPTQSNATIPGAGWTDKGEIRFTVGSGSPVTITAADVNAATGGTSLADLITYINTPAGRFGVDAAPSGTDLTLTVRAPSTENLKDVTYDIDGAGVDTKYSSLQVFDNVGKPVKLDIQLTKTSATTWEMTVVGGTMQVSKTLQFDAFGQLKGDSGLKIQIPNGKEFTLDMKGMTQLAGDYAVTGSANGNAPSAVKDAEFATDGTVYAVYDDGTRVAAYKLALATVPSPDNLAPRAGNVYEATSQSGDYMVGFAEEGGFGTIQSSALEGSNVDIGTELTAMIEAQTSYTANSKVFQTGSELLDVLMNLKR